MTRSGKDAGSATANARALQSVERTLHVNLERVANGWLAGHPVLIQPAVYSYRLYYAAIVGVLVWIFVRLSWAFPLYMAADVLATGNHYLLDVVGSAVLLVAAIAAASGVGSPGTALADTNAAIRPRSLRHGGTGTNTSVT